MFQLNMPTEQLSPSAERIFNTVFEWIFSVVQAIVIAIGSGPATLLLIGLGLMLFAAILFLPLFMMFRDPVPWKIFLAAAPWWIAFAPIGLGLTVFGIWTFLKDPNTKKS